MTIHPLAGPGEPSQTAGAQAGESRLSYAIRATGRLLAESPLAHEQFEEARHDQAHADLLAAAAGRAGRKASEARARAAAERHKSSPHRQIGRRFGAAAAATLALLDVMPAYWTAEAFWLDQFSTLILTALLCAALGGAMWLLDLFASRGPRSVFRVLAALLGAGFAAMFVMRLDYLQVTAGQGLLLSGLEALALTAVSAALVAVGYVLLSHRMPKAVASAERRARLAARSGAEEAAEAARAKAAMSRAALEDTVVAWAASHEPDGMGHEDFFQAIGRAIDVLLTR